MTPDRADHAQFEELAVGHVSGGLSSNQAQVFRAHLLDCPQCRARVGELRAIASDLADVERDERRTRTEEPVQVKRRARVATREQEREQPPPPAGNRVVFIVGLVFVVLLSVWNFTLRSSNAQLQESLDAEIRATAIGNFGAPWTPAPDTAERGVARSRGDDLVVLLDGAQDGATYVVELAGGDGDVLVQEHVRAVDGYVRYLGDLPAAVETVVVRLPSSAPDATARDGQIVFEATRPAAPAEGATAPQAADGAGGSAASES